MMRRLGFLLWIAPLVGAEVCGLGEPGGVMQPLCFLKHTCLRLSLLMAGMIGEIVLEISMHN